MISKRAVSTLVATVLLILIVVAAVAIIWGAIMPMMTTAMDIGRACLNSQGLTINSEGGYTCASLTNASVMVSRSAENFEVAGVKLALSAGGVTKSVTIRVGDTSLGLDPMNKNFLSTVIMMGNEASHTLQIPGSNEERTYVINTKSTDANTLSLQLPGKPEKASIAVIVKVGNTEKECSVSSIVTLNQCVE